MGARLRIVVVTGMSGAGRSSALRVLEDLGFFCVDNLPPMLAPELVRLLGDGELRNVGLGIDVRTGAFLAGADALLSALEAGGHDVEVVFLDCADEMLVRRYSETRRPHPLAPSGSVLDAIAKERERLAPLRARASTVLDTSRFSVHDLRRALVAHLSRTGSSARLSLRIVSFGFKYGLPVDADLVFDVRYLPNPHFVPELKPLTGRDAPVAEYVLSAPESAVLLADVGGFLERTLPFYEREGKAYLTVAIGCTGGQHRSVAIAEELGRALGRAGREAEVSHRDVSR